MSLAASSRLGPYELLAPLGSGGMGEVYRARDTRLGRDVAIKVLPGTLARDDDRLRRFEDEARATSALNHPNILAVHDVGRENGTPYAVYELLEGETLRERLRGAALPPTKVVDFGLQIARGLTAAHERGIVHRDLKPENLFVTRDGLVKILDFGLAKRLFDARASDAASDDAEGLPTRTRAGTVLGTVGYMAPEQVRGLPADHRADIFAFGAVLFELLSGRRPFVAPSAVETMNAILKDEPPELSSASGKLLPPGLERIVRHCLEKRPEDRFQSSRDLVFDLESVSGLADPPGSDTSVARRGVRRARIRRGLRGLVAAAGVLVIGTTGFWIGRRGFAALPEFHQITFRSGMLATARFASDPSTVVYTAAWDGDAPALYAGRLDSPEARSLDLPNQMVQAIVQNGEMLVVDAKGQKGLLGRVPLAGGAVRPIAEHVTGADATPDGQTLAIVRFAEGHFQLEYPVGQVLARSVTPILRPRISPDGRRVAFFELPFFQDDRGDVVVVDRDGHRRTLAAGWSSTSGLAWSPDGREVWFTAARTGALCQLMAVDLEGRVRHLAGTPVRLRLHDVARDGRVLLSADSVRAQIRALAPGATVERSLAWHDVSFAVDISADGKQVLFSESGEAGGRGYGVYVRATDGSPAVRLGEGRPYAFSPDGRWVLTQPLEGPLRLVLLPLGAGEARTFPLPKLTRVQVAAFAPPDGNSVLIVGHVGDRPLRVFRLKLEPGAEPEPVTEEGLAGAVQAISPDGRRMFGVELGTGKSQLVDLEAGQPVAPSDAFGLREGEFPLRFSADGRRLYAAKEGGVPPLEVVELDARGQRRPWRTVAPADVTGLMTLGLIRIAPEAGAYVYSLRSNLSNLFVVDGIS